MRLLLTLFLLTTSLLHASPNILVILTDDQGWGDLSLHGNTNLATPHIDSLARDGAQFDRFYVCPVCSPTRAEFLTGRYHPRGNVYSTSTGGERLDLDGSTIAEAFQKAGYATAAFGKWHNGMQYPYHPNARGFDEFYGFCSGHWAHYFSPLLDHNDALDLTRNTIVLFFCDNGPNGNRRNGDMRGRKGSTDEGGVRSPLLLRWPAHIKPHTRLPQIAAAIDLLPTLTDLADKFPEITAELQQAATSWRKEVLQDYGPNQDHRPFIVGHPDTTYTQLPACDAKPTGGIKFSNRYPNASYLTNWTSTDDRITWDIEVPADGNFEVTLYYTCPANDLGSTFEPSFGDHTLQGKITEPHDPPLRGAAEDRVPRTESYDKDFRPLTLGTLTLKKGHAPLTLRATDIPGAQGMDFRLLILKRIG